MITEFLPAIAEKSILALILVIGIITLWRYVLKFQDKRDSERAETQKMLFDIHERSLVAQNNSTQAMTQTAQTNTQLSVSLDKLRESSVAQHEAVIQEIKKVGKASLNGSKHKTATA